MLLFNTLLIVLSIVLLILGKSTALIKSWWVWIPYAALLVVFILHLVFEPVIWQMVPVYIVGVVILAGFVLGRFGVYPQAGVWHVLGLVGGFLLLVTSAAALYIFPVFKLPQPSGPYAVGMQEFNWVDESRLEEIQPADGRTRELIVEIYYPAGSIEGLKTKPYMTSDLQDAMAFANKVNGMPDLPGFMYSHYVYVNTHAYENAPAADGRFPVLLFSHGYMGITSGYQSYYEDLASHGYIVAVINHTYSSGFSKFQDGRIVLFSDISVKDAFVTDESAQDFFKSHTTYQQLDQSFVLDQMEKIEQGEISSDLAGHLDLENVGAVGHSLGGATSAESCLMDERFKACSNLDGSWVTRTPLQQPFLMMNNSESIMPDVSLISEADLAAAGMTREEVQALFESQVQTERDFWSSWNTSPAYNLTIKTFLHVDFCDAGFMSPLSKMLQIAASEPNRAHDIVLGYVLAFFDQYLKGIESPLLAAPSPDFPEVIFEKYP